MTTQLNEHQKTIQHYLSVLVGMCSEIKAGLTNEDYLRQVANDVDLDKINAALRWLDGNEKLPPDAKIPVPAEMRAQYITLKDVNGIYFTVDMHSLYIKLINNGFMVFGFNIESILELRSQYILRCGELPATPSTVKKAFEGAGNKV